MAISPPTPITARPHAVTSADQRRLLDLIACLTTSSASGDDVAFLQGIAADLAQIPGLLPAERRAQVDELNANERALQASARDLAATCNAWLATCNDALTPQQLLNLDDLRLIEQVASRLAQQAGEVALRAQQRTVLRRQWCG